MSVRWHRKQVPDNDGKTLLVWQHGEFEIAQEYWDGSRWMFELKRDGQWVDWFVSLGAAKGAAEQLDKEAA